jgi:phosphoribosyl-ATP pyrophosphohydrolase
MKTFEELFTELQSKSTASAEVSNTRTLLESGVHTIGKKVVEEAAEVWMAAEYESKDALALEISQLIYHLQVMMIAKGLEIKDLEEKF